MAGDYNAGKGIGRLQPLRDRANYLSTARRHQVAPGRPT